MKANQNSKKNINKKISNILNSKIIQKVYYDFI